jgi:hypothetical protein
VPSYKLNSLRILREPRKVELDFKRLEWLTRMDVLPARKPLELGRTTLVRGRTCELIASGSALGDPAGDVCAALTAQSAPGDAMKTVYDLCLACESADTSRIERLSGAVGIAGDEMASLYLNAPQRSDNICQTVLRRRRGRRGAREC